jgi:hypothetical protein
LLYYLVTPSPLPNVLNLNLHSPFRQLIDLRIEHSNLNALVDAAAHDWPIDELMLRKLKKRRLALRDLISVIEMSLNIPGPA